MTQVTKKKSSVKVETLPRSRKRVTVASSIEHVLPLGNGWIVKNDKAAKFTAITDTQKEAIEIARDIARKKNIVLLVHAKDGRIQLQESYVE